MTANITDLQVSVASVQYVRVPVQESTGGDPTGDTVSFAFPNPGTDPTVFYSGSWTTESGIYYARCLIGPTTSAVLGIGFYEVYVKIGDSPETPVLLSGLMEIF